LGDVEALISLEDGHSLISAHSFSDGPGSILIHHSLKLEMVEPPSDASSSKKGARSSNGASSSSKKGKTSSEPKIQLQPKITPTCLPLGTLIRPEEQTTSIHIIPGTNRLLQILKNGKCLVLDISDLSSLKKAPAPQASSSKKPVAVPKNPFILSEFDVGHEVVSSRLNPFDSNLLAVVGPHGTLSSVFDIEKGERTWKSRNVKHDMLKMEVPVSDMDIDWISEKRLVTCTAHSYVRVYDLPTRQPTLSVSVADEYAKSMGPTRFQQLTKGDVAFSLRAITCNPSSRTDVAVAANTGDVFILNLAMRAEQGHIRSRQKGVQGAIRALLFHPSRPNALVATGLDRFVRTWDASKSRSLGTLYTKLRQNCLAFTDVLAPILKTHKQKLKKEKAQRAEEESDEDSFHESDFSSDDNSEDDEMWDEMKVAGKKKGKRPSDQPDDSPIPPKKKKSS
jgi:hypothetical protein